MNILYLGEAECENITRFLRKFGEVKFFNNQIIQLDCVKKFDWIISYGYRYILDYKILSNTKNPIINLHISYLPYNRGAHPNYWSFKEKTPSGVSIHYLDEGIDTGPILVQERCYFENSETLKTSYFKLKNSIEEMFYKNFEKIINGEITPIPQTSKGTYHSKNDLPKNISWQTLIKNI